MLATIRDRLRGSVAEATKRGAVSREAQREATSDQTRLANLHPVLSSGLCHWHRGSVLFV